MAILHVHDVPDQLHEEIRRLARAEHRSLSAEVITLLSRAVGEPRGRGRVRDVLDEIKKHQFTPRPGGPSSTEMIREDRQR